MNQYKSAVDRLRSLPDVFDVRDVECLLNVTTKDANQYCWRWRNAGLIEGLGERKVGVHFNLVTNPQGPLLLRKEAIHKYFRLPGLVIGGSALHHHGWTTQRPHNLELAIPGTRGQTTVPQLNGYIIERRYLRWYATIAAKADEGVDGFTCVQPEFALADAVLMQYRNRKVAMWLPDADDIDIPGDQEYDSVIGALVTLGATAEEVERFTDEYARPNWTHQMSF
ncbi:hypothetical protein [Thalassospira xiamenensis]|uniref:Uncharacterized protein n=1 Tax=Thalassospira xiamenensis TaxID=220697 RepID=A0A285TXU9_9PROT|nr:hypothetical protein [Thalassospira xiamenensis]SOC27400.1 hypothetical protein SAMN05428964_105401 [Thalassospira xiamenensis]